MTDPGYVESKMIRARFPAAPTLVTMQKALNQQAIFGAMGFAINGVSLQNPFDRKTCCDGTFSRANDYCNGDTIDGRYSYSYFAGSSTEPGY